METASPTKSTLMTPEWPPPVGIAFTGRDRAPLPAALMGAT